MLQVIKANDVRDGELRRFYPADRVAELELKPSDTVEDLDGPMHSKPFIGSSAGWVAIVDRPAPAAALDHLATVRAAQPTFRVATDDDLRGLGYSNHWDAFKVLIGPDGWNCSLGEPEDCTWYRDGHDAVDMLNKQAAEIARLTVELAAANTLIASYESPTCDHRHPCRCGSGGHPRRCERHPNAHDRHIVELNAIGKTEAEREAVDVRICTIADEAFGPFPVHSADEACTAIERGAFEQRARIATLERALAAARAVPPDVEAAIGLVDAIVEKARTLDSYDWQSRLDDSRTSDDARDDARELGYAVNGYDRSNGSAFLRAAIARAIANAAAPPATVDIATAIRSVERIESTSRALGYSADYMAAIDRVLSCLRAVAENGGPLMSEVDGGTRQPATVGGLMATGEGAAVLLSIPAIEYVAPVRRGGLGQWRQMRAGGEVRCWRDGSWTAWRSGSDDISGIPARLVPADLADADPATRGPLPKVAPSAKTCADNSPAGYSGHWRDWHRGHGCDKDPERDGPLPKGG